MPLESNQKGIIPALDRAIESNSTINPFYSNQIILQPLRDFTVSCQDAIEKNKEEISSKAFWVAAMPTFLISNVLFNNVGYFVPASELLISSLPKTITLGATSIFVAANLYYSNQVGVSVGAKAEKFCDALSNSINSHYDKPLEVKQSLYSYITSQVNQFFAKNSVINRIEQETNQDEDYITVTDNPYGITDLETCKDEVLKILFAKQQAELILSDDKEDEDFVIIEQKYVEVDLQPKLEGILKECLDKDNDFSEERLDEYYNAEEVVILPPPESVSFANSLYLQLREILDSSSMLCDDFGGF